MNTATSITSFVQDGAQLSRVEYAYREIKHNVTTNVFPAGFRILEPELAEKLGVSRTPVREALIRLEQDKLIELIPRRGMRVLPIGLRDVEEILYLISMHELSAIHRVCSTATNPNFDMLNLYISHLQQAEIDTNGQAWIDAEEAFAMSIIATANNNRMLDMSRVLHEQIRRPKYQFFKSLTKKDSVLSNYRNILQNLKVKDFASVKSSHNAILEYYLAVFRDLQGQVQYKEL